MADAGKRVDFISRDQWEICARASEYFPGKRNNLQEREHFDNRRPKAVADCRKEIAPRMNLVITLRG